MSQENLKNVAIIGAGTIGLYLAWKLSKAGHNVTVFEKNAKVENKTCSGLISERLKDFIPIEESLIENKITSSLIHFPGKTITLNFKLNFLVIDRQKLNEKLYSLAQKSGAKILFRQPVNELPKGFDKVIGCDGALSKTKELLKLPASSLRLGFQTFLPHKDSSSQVETWPTKNGFLWKIPRGSQIEYGALGAVNSIRKDFDKFCQEKKINFGQNELKSALIPHGLVLPKDKRITLCGDSTGLTKPWSGGGVIWGLTAANILIKNFPDFTRYHRETKSFFGPKIFLGRISNSLVHSLGQNLAFLLPKKVLIDNDFLLK